MSKINSLPELLAPARTANIAITAISAGADAVYVGAPKFSARENAALTLFDIEKVVKYAHLYNAKVYAAINTLFKDEELSDAEKLIKKLYEVGCDALIIQDFSCLEMDLPPIQLHASTQMHNHKVDRVSFLKEVGFSRAVLPRELSLEETKTFLNLGIEIEVFVHGALCVSYSGQCYLSYGIGRRSANRGACAQPCRLKWKLFSGDSENLIKEGHFLSLKDLNRFNYLKELIEMGISSLKIEGRLKDEAYVKNTISAYRKEIDNIGKYLSRKKPSLGNICSYFKPDLMKTFHRGYTDYFTRCSNASNANFVTPKNIGEKIGNVKALSGEWITLDTKNHSLICGDGLIFLSDDSFEGGGYVNKVEGCRIILQQPIRTSLGCSIFRNHDKKFYDIIENTIFKRKLDAFFTFSGNISYIFLTLTDETGLKVSKTVPGPFDLAKQKEKMREGITDSLQKSGEGIFQVASVFLEFEEVPYLQKNLINHLRRNLILELTELRLSSYIRENKKHFLNEYPYPEKEIPYQGNVLNSLSKKFYERHGAKVLEFAPENGGCMNDKLVMVTRYCLRRELNACLKENKNRIIEPLILSNNQIKLFLKFDCKACKMEVWL